MSNSTKIYGKILATIFFVFILPYTLYNIYIWSVTQSTDNAYVEALISEVSAEISGNITKILVDENIAVTKDQEIAHIDPTLYQAQFDKAESRLKAATANIALIKQKIEIAKIEQSKAKESYEFAKQNIEIAEDDFIRTQELTHDKYASQRNFDQIKLNYFQTKMRHATAKLDIDAAENNLSLLDIQLQQAKLEHEAAFSDKLAAEKNLKDTVIRAPISGIMTNSILRKGNFVRPGKILFYIVPNQNIYVKANFKETQIKNFTIGMKAAIYIDALDDLKISGTIRNLSPATGSKFSLIPPQNASGNFTKIVQKIPVIIDLEIPQELESKILPGMSCVVKIRQ